MNKIIYIIILTLCMISSCINREKKAAQLIDRQMFYVLVDYRSYKPVETTSIDSAFSTIYTSPDILECGSTFKKAFDELYSYKGKSDEARTRMDKWADKSFEDFEKALYDYDKCSNDERMIISQINETMERMENLISGHTTEFIGWKVSHTYMAKNGEGVYVTSTETYYFNKDMTEITLTIDENDDEYKNLINIINDFYEE